MWYEILPSALGVLTAFTAANVAVYVLNQLDFKQPYARNVEYPDYQFYFLRDKRIGQGNAYKLVGLDGLPEEPVPQPKPEPEEELVCYIIPFNCGSPEGKNYVDEMLLGLCTDYNTKK